MISGAFYEAVARLMRIKDGSSLKVSTEKKERIAILCNDVLDNQHNQPIEACELAEDIIGILNERD